VKASGYDGPEARKERVYVDRYEIEDCRKAEDVVVMAQQPGELMEGQNSFLSVP
jgi:hypothetical protein